MAMDPWPGVRLLLASAVAVLLLPSSVSAARGQLDIHHIIGRSVLASMATTGPTGCIQTRAYVVGTNDTHQRPPGPPQQGPLLFVGLFQVDQCTQTTVLSASGMSTDATAITVTVDGGLRSATVTGTVALVDYVAGRNCTAAVELTLTGAGALATYGDHARLPGIGIENINGQFRQATVDGSVAGCGVSVPGAATEFAHLAFVTDMALERVR
jgi:hypothetical protein